VLAKLAPLWAHVVLQPSSKHNDECFGGTGAAQLLFDVWGNLKINAALAPQFSNSRRRHITLQELYDPIVRE
jgi:hypothetical protein